MRREIAARLSSGSRATRAKKRSIVSSGVSSLGLGGGGGGSGVPLVPAAPGALEAYPVSKAVSNVRNNGPELMEPLPLEDVPELAGS